MLGADRRVPHSRPGSTPNPACARACPLGEQQERDDHDELEHREHRRALEVEQRRGEQVDLGLDGRVAQPTEGEHDAECGGAEEEDDARRGDDRRAQRGQGDGAQDLRRGGAEGRRRLAGARVEAVPSGAHRAHDDADVEEDHRKQDRHPRPVEPQPPERAGGCEQPPPQHADDDGRHDEGHDDERPQQTGARQVEPVERVGGRHSEREGHRRREGRDAGGEAEHPCCP